MGVQKNLAKLAMLDSIGYKLTKGEDTNVSTGALINAYAESLTTYEGLEGVHLRRPLKPICSEEKRTNQEVKKMFVVSNIINEEYHMFDNIIILN